MSFVVLRIEFACFGLLPACVPMMTLFTLAMVAKIAESGINVVSIPAFESAKAS
jgi:hypothetical protein